MIYLKCQTAPSGLQKQKPAHLIEGGDVGEGKDLELEPARVLVALCVRLCSLCIGLLFLQGDSPVVRWVIVQLSSIDAPDILEIGLHGMILCLGRVCKDSCHLRAIGWW